MHIAQPPGADELYVVEKPGRVVVLDRDGEPRGQPFLDLRRAVKDDGKGGEQGLLSIAFAPDYEESGVFYAYYTGLDGNQNVVEFKRSASDPDKADPASEREVLKMEDFASNHNGGLVVFGPGGGLYIGTTNGTDDRIIKITPQ